MIRKAMTPYTLTPMGKMMRQLQSIAQSSYVSQTQKILNELNRSLSTYQKMVCDLDRLARSPSAHIAAADKIVALVGKQPKGSQ